MKKLAAKSRATQKPPKGDTTDISYIKAELASIRTDLKNIQGYRQEIDYALTRIARIEQHLGITS